MFTKKNTAEETHVVINKGRVIFFNTSGVGSLYTLDGREWYDEICNLPGVIELSRPQSDIVALFNDAPDWVTDYAWLIIGRDRVYYWLNDKGFMCLDKSCITKFRRYGGNHAVMTEFTIIATRPPVEQPAEDATVAVDDEALKEFKLYETNFHADSEASKGKPVYTQEVFLQAGPNGAWMPCEVIFVGSRHTIVRTINGREHCRKTAKIKLRDIDTRTDEEKILDDMIEYLTNQGIVTYDPIMLKMIISRYGIEYTGK